MKVWRNSVWLALLLSSPAQLISISLEARSIPVASPGCNVATAEYEGWQAQQLGNEWLKLMIVPKLGGRLMQVIYAGHPFLFVNPEYKGKYFPPLEANATPRWYNYGGDKIWPMPEGSGDAQHWPGPVSDLLDDGDYVPTITSQGSRCGVRLDGPPDPRTGLQYSREISIDRDSPEISFHAVMKNASTHPIRWSMQSVTQYDTADPKSREDFNHHFFAATPANPKSAYLEGYHVRFGLAGDPSILVRDNWFIHSQFVAGYQYLQSEIWVDSPGDWLAVIDFASHFGIAERFRYESSAEYPGKASVIFYRNGSAIELDAKGRPAIRTTAEDAPYYMEAEINSPLVSLEPGETYAFDTQWYPTKIGESFVGVTQTAVISAPLSFTRQVDGNLKTTSIEIHGEFGVFFPGQLVAHLFDEQGNEHAVVVLQQVAPSEAVILHQKLQAFPDFDSVSIHLVDRRGIDRGIIDKVFEIHEAPA